MSAAASPTPARPSRPLPAPQGVSAQAGRDKVLLAWNAVVSPDASKVSYQVFRSDAPLSVSDTDRPDPINLNPVTEEYFLDTARNSRLAPQADSEYYYAVMAVDSAGNSSPLSAPLRVVNTGTLCPPMGAEAQPGDRSVTLTWQEPFCTGERALAGYQVFRSARPGERGAAVSPLLQTLTFTDRGSDASPLKNGTQYYYTVLAQDSAGMLSEPGEVVSSTPYLPATAPAGMKASAKTDDSIELRWNASTAGTFPISGYNVYRAVTGSALDGPINRKPVAGTNYIDSETNSVSKPILGTTYAYQVRAVDKQGNESPDSNQDQASPKAPVDIPATGIFSTAIPGLPPESSLTISGRKKIDLGYTNLFALNVKDGNTDRNLSSASSLKKGFNLEQELQVKLQGKVGKKIAVDVDYDDRTEDQRKISINYAGDPNEVVQEAAFGDIKLDLPRTEFAGYNKELFGAKLRVGLDRFRFTAIGAQTKGITVTETFKGNASPRTVDIQDLNFDAFKYYYLTYDHDQVNHPDLSNSTNAQGIHGIVPGSVEVYVTNGVSNADTVRITRTESGGAVRVFAFNRLAPGIDFTVDFDLGILTFTSALQSSWSVAVAYRYYDANQQIHSVGYTSAGTFDFTPENLIVPSDRSTRDSAHLIQDYDTSNGNFDYRMMLMNRYYLGYQNIMSPQTDPDFQIKVFNTSGQEIPIAQPSNATASDLIYTIDPNFGTIHFRHNYPFQGSKDGVAPTPFASDDYDPVRTDAYNPLHNARLGTSSQNDGNLYRIHIRFKNQISTFQLAHIGVIKNSEVIKKDGNRLRRDTDYYIDYDSGFITFTNAQEISSSTDITVSYEYMPFGGKYQSNLFGARGEYDLIPNKLSLGSTFLYNSSQAPQDVPDIKSTPTSLSLIDGDTKLSLNPDDFTMLFKPILGGAKVPISLDISAEGAYSNYAVNTYRRAGENGAAMIDNMDGSDDMLTLPNDDNIWFPSSAPPQFTGADTREYMIQSTVYEVGRVPTDADDKKTQLRWSYFTLDSSKWDGFVYPLSTSGTNLHNYRYLEISVFSSADATNRVKLNFDLGIVNEDSNGNNRLNFEGDGVTSLQSGQNIGIVNYLAGYDGSGQRVVETDPQGPNGIYSSNYPEKYWGKNNNIYRIDSEDLDKNGNLDTINSYYEYEVTLSPGWNYIKIPLTQFTGRSPGAMQPTDQVLSAQFLSYIKHVRMWVTGTSAAPNSGYVQFESVQLTGNRWVAQVAAGAQDAAGNTLAEPDPLKFNATTVSQDTDSTYVPNTNFYIYDTTNEAQELKNERSLQLQYQLGPNDVVSPGSATLSAESAYLLTRTLSSGTGNDYSNYKYLRMDVFKKTETAHGEVLFIRLAMDDNNYYQYNLSLDDIIANESWQTLTVRLDGSDNNRTSHFQSGVIPNLNQIKQISIGVLNPNNLGQTETLWINNLRVTDGQARMGGAYRVTSSTKISDILTVGTDFRDVDSDFMTIDETPSGKQHQTTSSVTAKLTKLPYLPISASWNRTANYTEEQHRDNPAYSNSFALPDTVNETVSGDIGYTQIPGLDVLIHASRLNKNIEYIQQRYDANNRQILTTLNPSISYTLPDRIFNFPIGSTTLSGSVTFKNDQIDYDAEGTSRLARTDLYDRWTQTRDESYSYRGNYQPISYLSFSPSFTYNVSSSRGYLSLYRFYAELDPTYTPENTTYFSDKYRTSRLESIAKLDINLMNIPVISPSISYAVSNVRDYITDSLTIPNGMLSVRTGLAPGDLFGWNRFPKFNLSRNYSLQATFQHKAGETSDPISKQDLKSLWWIDPFNFEKADSKFDLAYINSKTYTDSVNTSFNLTDDINLSPRYEYTWKRSSSYNNPTTTENLSLGAGLVWNRVPILQTLLGVQSLNFDYSYRQTLNRDATNIETSKQTSHNSKLTLPMRFSSDLNGSAAFGLISTANLSGTSLNNIAFQNEYTGDFDIGYNLRMLQPIRLPNFWPFNGMLLKIDQTLRIQNSTHVDFVRNTGQNLIGQDLTTNTIRNDTSIDYSLWRNVQGDLKVSNEWFYSLNQDNRDYYALSVSLGLTATF